MKDEQLLQFNPDQARQQLNDEQLERYNKLKADKLQKGIQNKKKNDAKNASNALANLRQAKENELTVEVHGIEFLADIPQPLEKKLLEVADFSQENKDKKINAVKPERLDDIRQNILDVLAELDRNNNREKWEEEFGDAGIVVLGRITGDLLDRIDDYMEQKKSRLNS